MRGGVAEPSSSRCSARLREPGDVDLELGQDALVLLDGPWPAQRELDARLQQRERGAQLVACVVHEPALARQRLLERGEHLVEGLAQTSHLVVAVRLYVEP